jgi:dolichol-phosphate mannosyltransferase
MNSAWFYHAFHEADCFLAVTELLVKAVLMGFRVAEFPTVLRARVVGASKARLASLMLAHMGFQRRVLLHRLHARDLVDRRHVASGAVRPGPLR